MAEHWKSLWHSLLYSHAFTSFGCLWLPLAGMKHRECIELFLILFAACARNCTGEAWPKISKHQKTFRFLLFSFIRRLFSLKALEKSTKARILSACSRFSSSFSRPSRLLWLAEPLESRPPLELLLYVVLKVLRFASSQSFSGAPASRSPPTHHSSPPSLPLRFCLKTTSPSPVQSVRRSF